MSADDELVETARSFLIDMICEMHPPGADRERLLAWAAQLPAEDLLLPGPEGTIPSNRH